MKKQTLTFLLAVVFLAMVAGCATTKRVELLENRLGADELDHQMTREKLAKVESSQKDFSKDLSVTKDQLLQVTKETTEAIQGLRRSNAKNETGLNEVRADITATKTQVQGLTLKTEDLEKGIGLVKAEVKQVEKQVQKEYKDLRVYALNLRKIIAEREAKHSYKADEVEGISVYLVGTFAKGEATLNKDLETGLNKTLEALKNKQEELLEIHGFADITGFKGKTPEESEKLNQELSINRGKTTQVWFKGKGLDVSDDKIRGFGGVVKFGTERDNRCVVIFAKPTTPSVQTPPPTK